MLGVQGPRAVGSACRGLLDLPGTSPSAGRSERVGRCFWGAVLNHQQAGGGEPFCVIFEEPLGQQGKLGPAQRNTRSCWAVRAPSPQSEGVRGLEGKRSRGLNAEKSLKKRTEDGRLRGNSIFRSSCWAGLGPCPS